MTPSSTALNLEAIDKAIRLHDAHCTGEIVAIWLNPFEYARLGWTEYKGIPIVAASTIGTGRFRLVCERDEADVKAMEAARSKSVQAEV